MKPSQAQLKGNMTTMQNIEYTSPTKVFLVSGRVTASPAGALPEASGGVVQRVVTADDEVAAFQVLREKEPHFQPIGIASLADYQAAVQGVLNTLAGKERAWPLYRQRVSPSDG